MDKLLAKTFDFAIRIVELSNYLEEEGKQFPLIAKLIECGTGIGARLRIAEGVKNRPDVIEAYKLSLETEYILELLVKTGFLNKTQSMPILSDCRWISNETAKQIGKR